MILTGHCSCRGDLIWAEQLGGSLPVPNLVTGCLLLLLVPMNCSSPELAALLKFRVRAPFTSGSRTTLSPLLRFQIPSINCWCLSFGFLSASTHPD